MDCLLKTPQMCENEENLLPKLRLIATHDIRRPPPAPKPGYICRSDAGAGGGGFAAGSGAESGDDAEDAVDVPPAPVERQRPFDALRAALAKAVERTQDRC